MTAPVTAPVTVPDESLCLKDYLIFLVDALGGCRELSDESALETEAARYAGLVAAAEGDAGIHYEVRLAATGGLLHTTEDHDSERKEEAWLKPTQMAML